MTNASVTASEDVYINWIDWGLKLDRMTHASVGTDLWTVVQNRPRSRNRIYSFGFVIPASIIELL
jgi:hypothetical protein